MYIQADNTINNMASSNYMQAINGLPDRRTTDSIGPIGMEDNSDQTDSDLPEGNLPSADAAAKHATDKAFFSAAVDRLMDRMYATAMRFTRNQADAEDLMADAMLKAWKSFDSLQDRDNFDGWMMRILSNTYISRWRRNNTHQKIFDDDLCTSDIDDTESLYARLHQPFLLWFGTPEQTFVNSLLRQDIESALDSLSDSYRMVVMMIEVMGFSYEETAEALEVPIGTIRSRLNRGRRQLQNALWQHAQDAALVTD